MKQVLRLLLLLALLCQVQLVLGAASSDVRAPDHYNRRLTQVLTPETLADSYLVTFSENGLPETLPLFVLELFATNGNLTDYSLNVVQWAMNYFLLAELNAVFSDSGNPISAVNTTVFSQLPMVLLDTNPKVWGSQLQTIVNVTFSFQPSPVVSEVADTTKSIMQDLTNFVSNLTAYKDPQLTGVYLAIRVESVTAIGNEQSGHPGSGANGSSATTGSTASSSSGSSRVVVIPSVVGSAAVVIALVAFLALRRRKYRRPAQADDKDAPDLAYLDLESDFASSSFDHSLPTSSKKSTTPRSLVSPNGMDSTFDGLDAMSIGTGSPMNASPRCKSLMSGLSNGSATTIKISNVARSFRRNLSPRKTAGVGSPTPKSTAASSLFAFLEEEAAEDSSTESKPSLQTSDVSEDEEQPHGKEKAARLPSSEANNDQDLMVPTNNVTKADSPSDGPLFEFPQAWCSLSSPAAHVMDDPVTPEAVLADLQAVHMNQNQQLSSTPGDSSTRAVHGSALQKRLLRSAETESPASDFGTPLRRNPRDPSSGLTDDVDRLPYWDTGSPPSRHLTSPLVASAAQIAVGRHHRDDETSEGNGSTTEGTGESEGESLRKSSGAFAGAFPRWDNDAVGDDEHADGNTGKSDSTRNRRRADYRGTGDGSDMYQMSAMHPLDWSNKSADGMSVGDSTLSDSDEGGVPRHFVMSPDNTNARAKTNTNNDQLLSPSTKSPASYNSKSSRYSTLSESGHTKDSRKSEGSSSHSASRQLINDLVWLEKKISDVRNMSASNTPAATPRSFPGVINTDSLSYMSGDANVSPSSNEDEGTDPSSPVVAMQSIICRDCYAPPGKLQIVIHSTKDGPAVHTVKAGSNLEGQVFPGDLIIAVDNIDTRSHTAEQVMKMMIAKSGFERKITVLHYEE
jgi:hypothetical protein